MPSVWAAEQTWTGKLSDSLCGASHQAKRDAAAGFSDRECAIDCIKRLGKYVLVDASGKVVPIANQDFAGLPLHADHLMKVTGELKDDAIVLSKIERVDDRHAPAVSKKQDSSLYRNRRVQYRVSS